MNTRLVVVASVVVIVLLAGTFLVAMQPGAASGSSTGSSSSTTVQTSESYVNATQNLELQLSANASSTGGPDGNVTISITVDEYNTLATANNVSKAAAWGLDGLSLGACGTEVYPFGVALYSGVYTAGNVSQGSQLQIFPVVPCPLFMRLVTGYLFQPMSDQAVVLPGGTGSSTMPMWANVTATEEYKVGGSFSAATPLGPGTYTVAVGDEWGSVVLVHFTVGAGGGSASSTSSAVTATGSTGTLVANFSVGPTEPVCSANSTVSPASAPYPSIEAVITSQSSGAVVDVPIPWLSSGCDVYATVQTSLLPGSYTLNLSSCQWMGCASALPKSFAIVAGQSASVDVSIDTGIR